MSDPFEADREDSAYRFASAVDDEAEMLDQSVCGVCASFPCVCRPAFQPIRRMTAQEIVDYLTWCNYRQNREVSPHVTPQQWEVVYGPKTAQMELRYQLERNHES